MTIEERKKALGAQLNQMKAQRESLQVQLTELSNGILRIEGAIMVLVEMEQEAAKEKPATTTPAPLPPVAEPVIIGMDPDPAPPVIERKGAGA